MSEQMTMALEDVLTEDAAEIKETGGCEHDVGICWCKRIRDIEAARNELADIAAIVSWFIQDHQGEGSGLRYVAASEARDRILARMKR